MKRELTCRECAIKAYQENPNGEYIKKVYGNAIGYAFCDICNLKLELNSPACAISVALTPDDYFHWEDEFIEIPTWQVKDIPVEPSKF